MSGGLPGGGNVPASTRLTVSAAQSLLRSAVALLDSIAAPAEFAARIQASIDALDHFPYESGKPLS
jgi:hypothetical protein